MVYARRSRRHTARQTPPKRDVGVDKKWGFELVHEIVYNLIEIFMSIIGRNDLR